MTSSRIPQKIYETIAQKWLLRFYLFLADNANNFRLSLVHALEVLRQGLTTETEQTKEMLQIYVKQSKGKASVEEVKRANKQFRELVRSLGLGVLLFLPFSPITLPLVVKLGRRLGVDVLPDSFKGILERQ